MCAKLTILMPVFFVDLFTYSAIGWFHEYIPKMAVAMHDLVPVDVIVFFIDAPRTQHGEGIHKLVKHYPEKPFWNDFWYIYWERIVVPIFKL